MDLGEGGREGGREGREGRKRRREGGREGKRGLFDTPRIAILKEILHSYHQVRYDLGSALGSLSESDEEQLEVGAE